jgi:hypothetical protein
VFLLAIAGRVLSFQLEGVLSHYPEDLPLVGLLVSKSEFSQAAVTRAISSPTPLLLVHLPPDAHDEHFIASAVWNAALGASGGLLKDAFQLRWEPDQSDYRKGRPGLYLGSTKITPDMPPVIP